MWLREARALATVAPATRLDLSLDRGARARTRANVARRSAAGRRPAVVREAHMAGSKRGRRSGIWNCPPSIAILALRGNRRQL